MREIHADQTLQAVARRQKSLFTTKQAYTAGFSPRTLGKRFKGGAYIRFEPSVYGWPATPSRGNGG
ncbi:MAG: type IV toxin-antitoxin system AbiEi family antitoxin domain-containing protein [Acidimicrobiales bacterium]